jgi:D-alanyl-lipoteichoic acid acyltransferase DltB (MBOAT superfamily)
VIPYADFTYFVLLLYVAVPTVILGLFGRAGWRWALMVTTVMLLVQYRDVLHLRAHFPVREIWLVLAFASWQWLIVRAFASAGARAGWLFYGAIGLSVLPLALAKVISARFTENSVRISRDFLRHLSCARYCVLPAGRRYREARHSRSIHVSVFLSHDFRRPN